MSMTRSIDKRRLLAIPECSPHTIYKIHEGHDLRRQAVSSGYPYPLINSREDSPLWRYPHRRIRKFLICIKMYKHCRHVSPSSVPLSLCRRSKQSSYAQVLRNKYSILHLHGPSMFPSLSRASSSSGQSSPQSSFSSSIFSSSASRSSRSPPSSHNSIADLSASSPYIRPQPRIQVSSLLADPYTRSYHLEIVQQPHQTAEFGMANLSRLPLTPPIIARLTVRDPSGNSVVPEAELPFLIAHLSLYTNDGSIPLDMGSSIGRGQAHSPPILYGNLVSVVDQLEDLQGNMGLFFLFPDVSIRWRGRYQLGVTLSRLPNSDLTGVAERGTTLAQTRTDSFQATALHAYTATPQTRLTQSFIRQGARMFTNTPHSHSYS
ncbi:velvet factor-domain-containing protein [Crassisporium funariophilum]|nr:velvet factor-domain-containing protein [Crassisporium funariophilum]